MNTNQFYPSLTPITKFVLLCISSSYRLFFVVRFIKAQRNNWLGHIRRIDQARPTRKPLDWKPMGIRPVARPRLRWQEDVMGDLKKLTVKNWKETAKDIRKQRDLAERAKTHKGF